jgi:hypothetical protein
MLMMPVPQRSAIHLAGSGGVTGKALPPLSTLRCHERKNAAAGEIFLYPSHFDKPRIDLPRERMQLHVYGVYHAAGLPPTKWH